MTFNVLDSEIKRSRDYVLRVIRAAEADVVALQEAEGYIPELATSLAWHHDSRAGILSRYPLSHVLGYWSRITLPCRVGLDGAHRRRSLLASSIHLPPYLYGPEQLRNGVSNTEVVRIERQIRLPALNTRLETLQLIAAAGNREPTVLMGDFNTLSHLDSVSTSAPRWPISTTMDDYGLSDSFRVVRPDPTLDPGLTWWAVRDSVECSRRTPCTRTEPSARIDFIYTRDVVVIDSMVVGESRTDADLVVPGWRSDHRAVLTTISVP